MIVITPDQLRSATPKCQAPDEWAPILSAAMARFGIAQDWGNTVEFLAQCAHESREFNKLEESLKYSAPRLVQVWPKRFPTEAVAAPYANNPKKLANFIYANRMGNRDEASGDGWNTRGRGLIMITGTANYRRVGALLMAAGLHVTPDYLSTKEGAANASAAWWMDNPKLQQLAIDQPDDDDQADFVAISRIVNGGVTGLAERGRFLAAFKQVVKAP